MAAVCNTDTGTCETTPAEDGTPCEANNQCAGEGTCTDGDCVAGLITLDCDDSDDCTTDACDPDTGCVNSPIENCCNSDDDCVSTDPCVSSTCENNVCSASPVADCCVENGECDDQNDCTADTCENNACMHAEIAGCGACQVDSDCDDQDDCTADTCHETAGCVNVSIDLCCAESSECDDQDDCTTDVCTNNECTFSPVPGCGDNCQDATDCDDQDPCTIDLCQLGVCSSYETANCCTQDSDCDDSNTCTDDTCVDGSCTLTPNGTCADGVFVFCTLTGAAGTESTCEMHFAAVSNQSTDQLGGFQVSIKNDPAKAEFTGFSCPPGQCAGLEGGTLSSTHLVTGAVKGPGEYMMLSFSITSPGPYNDAVYQNGQFTGNTYVMTMHFTHLTNDSVDIEGHDFVGSDPIGKELTVQIVDSVLVSSKK